MNRYTGNRKNARERQLNRIRLFIGVVFVLFLIMCILGLAQYYLNRKQQSKAMEESPSLPGVPSVSAIPESAPAMDSALALASVAPEETLPIIITNTPTPTPSPTPTASPEPTPTPSPTPIADLGSGKVNRESNLREAASAKAKNQKKIAKNTAVTIHDAIRDEEGNGWYSVTVEPSGPEGWIRDYLVTLSDGREFDDFVPPAVAESEGPVPDEQRADQIGRAVTNRSTNVREEPKQNGKIARQISEGVRLSILGYYGNDDAQWYEVETESGKTHGFVRAYTVNVTELSPDAEMLPYEQETDPGNEPPVE